MTGELFKAYGLDVHLTAGRVIVSATSGFSATALGSRIRVIEANEISAIEFRQANPLRNGLVGIETPNGATRIHFRMKSRREADVFMAALRGAVGPDVANRISGRYDRTGLVASRSSLRPTGND